MTSLAPPPSNSINLKYPLQYANAGAFATNDTTLDAVADDLKVLIKTNWGERVIHYDFGANLRAIIFAQSGDVEQEITNAVTSAIEKWMPYVNILNLMVNLTEKDGTVDYNGAQINLQFSVGKTGLVGTLQVNV